MIYFLVTCYSAVLFSALVPSSSSSNLPPLGARGGGHMGKKTRRGGVPISNPSALTEPVDSHLMAEMKKKQIDAGANETHSCHFENSPDIILPVTCVAETDLPTDRGNFRIRAYRVKGFGAGMGEPYPLGVPTGLLEPCVIYCADKPPFGPNGGERGGAKEVPVRVNDQCLTSEVFGCQRCDCREQLELALEHIRENGGAIIYLQQEGRGIGLANKLAAYALQDEGLDTVDANTHLGFPEDARQYGVVPSILEDMRIDSIRLMTNNPRKIERLHALGVDVTGTIQLVVPNANPYNRKYLQTKKERMSHTNFGSMLSSSPGFSTLSNHRNG